MTAQIPSSELPGFIKALSHELRWRIVNALTLSDYRVLELVEMIGQPINLVSYHLRLLREQELIVPRRSDADGRDVYYSLNLPALQNLYHATGIALHLLPDSDVMPVTNGSILRVLFLCTGNSARSQMAEGFLRAWGGSRVKVTSAGSEPAGVHPLAVCVMAEQGIDISGQESRHVDDLARDDFDYVITVCDRMREVCPNFPGIVAHWSIPDPVNAENANQEAVFRAAAQSIAQRVRYFLRVIAKQDAA